MDAPTEAKCRSKPGISPPPLRAVARVSGQKVFESSYDRFLSQVPMVTQCIE